MANKPEHSRSGLRAFPVAGIGASAGGVQALRSFFEALPARVGAALVVIVHLDPEYQSEMTRILSSCTQMPVLQVDRPLALEPDHVYVIPPNRRLFITDDEISAAEFDEPRGQRAPIDLFFRSLAEQRGDGFAIVLTGAGSDGTIGVKAVKESGGLILVQDPNEAEFPSMPRSAIASGNADFVLPVRELARQFIELLRSREHLGASDLDANEDALRRILGHLRARTGHDFTQYKRATVMRRLARRMQVGGLTELEDYVNLVRENAEETRSLFSDLLISVTNFFRDPACYKELTEVVIPHLFDDREPGHPTRVWVPGCATGEEAYTIAILLQEEAERRHVRPEIQLFATDIDTTALAAARDGRYPMSIEADVNEARLRRYFTKEGDHYRIKAEIRDAIVFAEHSLLKDPPFSRVDLISCRNLLIYLDRELQVQVCSTFNYALVPNGYLFLGSSESAETPSGLFRVVSRESRIFRSSGRASTHLPPLTRVPAGIRFPETPSGLPRTLSPVQAAAEHRQALETLAPPSILVDQMHKVLHISETGGRYMEPPPGQPTTDAAELARPELRLDLRAALHRAFEQGAPTLTLPVPVKFNGSARNVSLHVRPVKLESGTPAAMVPFLEGGEASEMAATTSSIDQDSQVKKLADELFATRAHLKASREEYGAATEDLRAANEELQSINEEYRSTAEELETSKEELQSMNEELQTLNNELKLKLEAVSQGHNDLQNLMSATDVGTLFLDKNLNIKRFTPRVTDLFNIKTGDEGRPITDFTHHLTYDALVSDTYQVMNNLVPIEHELRSTNNRWFLMRLRPYRTLDDKIEGVIVTFIDLTERKNAEARQQLLMHELSHRVNNTLSVVQSIAVHTLRERVPTEALEQFTARLQALAASNEHLVRSAWQDVDFVGLLREQLAPYLGEDMKRLKLEGQPIRLPAANATELGLIFHELASNAVRYGALSNHAGRIDVNWQLNHGGERGRLMVVWTERDGPRVKKPEREGFGSFLMLNGLIEGRVTRDFKPSGLVCTIEIPLSQTGAGAARSAAAAGDSN